MRKRKKYSPKERQELGEKLLAWANEPGNWHVCKFEHDHNLPVETLKKLSYAFPEDFQDYYLQAKEILGHKLLERAITKGTDRWIVSTCLPHYIGDIEEYLDARREKELLAAAKAKRIAESAADERANKLIDSMEKYVDAASRGE